MNETQPAPTAGLTASAGSGTPAPLAYAGGGVRWHRDAGTLHVFVPADRNARTAVGLSVAFSFIGALPIQMWNCWKPVARACVIHAPWWIILAASEEGVWWTAFAAAVWGVFIWLLARWTRPVIITAGPIGIRYEVGKDLPKLLPRGQIVRVRCGRLPSNRFATLNASGRFSNWAPWRVSRRLAAGSRADMEAVADELRSVLGPLRASDKAADGIGGPTSDAGESPMPSAAVSERP